RRSPGAAAWPARRRARRSRRAPRRRRAGRQRAGTPTRGVRARQRMLAAGCALQPTLGARQSRRLDAVLRAELADRLREVVAHGALGEVQLARDVGAALPVAGTAQHLPFAI